MSKIIKSNNGLNIIVDDEDYEKLSKNKWGINSSGYPRRTSLISDGFKKQKTILMHRFIMNFPTTEIDHINRNKLDNRKCNLRLVNREKNLSNRDVSRVEYDKKSNKYYPRITYFKNKLNLGAFNTYEEAKKNLELLYTFLWENKRENKKQILKLLRLRLKKRINTMSF